MKHGIVALLVGAGAAVAACSSPPERSGAVGRTFAAYVDETRPAWTTGDRPRPLNATIWYPAAANSQEQPWRVGVFLAGWTAPDAAMASMPERLPLIVLSHGTGGATPQLSWLAEALTANGFLVAAVNHHGNTAAEQEYLPHGFALWWERARDLSVLIDRLLADPRFGPRIDPDRIGAAGFSLGGYTVLALAGARVDRDRYVAFCSQHPADPSCVPPPEASFSLADLDELRAHDGLFQASLAGEALSYRDERVRSVYAIAPVLGPALDVQSLAEIDIPVRLVVGDRDDQARPEVTAQAVAASVTGADLQILPGVAHYTFLAPCTLRGRIVLRALCADPRGTDRRDVHRRIGDDATTHFLRVLTDSR